MKKLIITAVPGLIAVVLLIGSIIFVWNLALDNEPIDDSCHIKLVGGELMRCDTMVYIKSDSLYFDGHGVSANKFEVPYQDSCQLIYLFMESKNH